MAFQLAWLHAIICQQICANDTLGQRFSICPSHRKAKLKKANVILSCFAFLRGRSWQCIIVTTPFTCYELIHKLITDVLKRVCTDSFIKGRLVCFASPHRQENAVEERVIYYYFFQAERDFSMYILHEKWSAIKYIQYPNNACFLFFLENNLRPPFWSLCPPCLLRTTGLDHKKKNTYLKNYILFIFYFM